MKWTIEEGGTLGAGSEQSPVQYPRSNDTRVLSDNNKGAASVSNGPGAVNYKVGPYPVVDEEAETEGSGTA